jgi:hypothetical protein
VDIQARMTADGRGWYARVVVARRWPGELVVVPLGQAGPTSFPTLEEASAAARALARAWIDREEGGAR